MMRWNALLSTVTLAFFVTTTSAQQITPPQITPPSTPPAAPGSDAPPTPRTAFGPHGGEMHVVGTLHCEIVLSPATIEVFVFDGAGQPVVTRHARGRVTLRAESMGSVESAPRSFHFDLYPQSGKNAPVNALGVGIDLSRLSDRNADIEFSLHGIVEQPVTIATTMRRHRALEQIAVRRQRICPVSGKPLGSMGAPKRVTVKGQPVFVCCQGCIKMAQQEPDKVLRTTARLSAEGRALR